VRGHPPRRRSDGLDASGGGVVTPMSIPTVFAASRCCATRNKLGGEGDCRGQRSGTEPSRAAELSHPSASATDLGVSLPAYLPNRTRSDAATALRDSQSGPAATARTNPPPRPPPRSLVSPQRLTPTAQWRIAAGLWHPSEWSPIPHRRPPTARSRRAGLRELHRRRR
jgi:hypothetical protein